MSALRKSGQRSCLVGCLGEINAGKTTLMQGLMGKAPNLEGYQRRHATTYVAAQRMHLHTSTGLKEDPAAPILVDTPGFFDTDEQLREAALQQAGMIKCLDNITAANSWSMAPIPAAMRATTETAETAWQHSGTVRYSCHLLILDSSPCVCLQAVHMCSQSHPNLTLSVLSRHHGAVYHCCTWKQDCQAGPAYP